jgi:tetratricopeptide (TPR) repeat protein
MGSFCMGSHPIRPAGFTSCGCAALFLLTFTLLLQSQDSASLRGTVRNSQGTPLAGVAMYIRASDTTQAQTGHTDQTNQTEHTVQTDLQGRYSFPALRGGVYLLRAGMAGYNPTEASSLFIGPKETKNVDLTLLPVSPAATPPASAPEFFDPPQFTVAGVTDTTSLGGHGSDTVVRARESIAKETVSLGKDSAHASAVAASGIEQSLRKDVEREPENFEANQRLGKTLVENGKAREAIPYLERARELRSGDYENSYELALANARAGNYERARDSAQALLAHHDEARLHHLLGDVQEKLGNSLEAVREYQRAAELEPSEAYLFDWGSELLLHHAPEPALEVFTQGNRLFPRSVRMLIGLGSAWFARGSYDQAVQRICAASDLDPKDSTPYLFLGRMQGAESAPSAQAVEKLRRFAEQQPQSAAANYYYAVGLWKLRKRPQDNSRAAQIESLLTNATHLDHKFAAAYVQLGILYSEQKEYRRAISGFQQAIQGDSQLEEAHYRLAQAYRQIGNFAKADAELKVYDRIARESAQKTDRERHEIRQFVYTLRDQPPSQAR